MKAVYVEPVKTPLSFDEAADAMRQGIFVATGVAASTPALALALSKTALETGRWQSMWNWSWGNVKAGPQYVGMYTCYPCNEVIGGQTIWFAPGGRLNRRDGEIVSERYEVPPGHPQTRFRAHANAYDGAQSYVEFVANGRYRDAWELLLKGDPGGYVHALKIKGYFTADEAVYRRGVERIYQEFLKRLEALRPDRDEQTKPDLDLKV